MADTGIYATTAQILRKAGLGASIAASDEVYTNDFIAQAEAVINMISRKVFAVDSTAFSALPATTRQILTQVASDLAAIDVITYDMSGYASRIEAEDLINIRRDSSLRGLSLLRDQKQKDFLPKGTL